MSGRAGERGLSLIEALVATAILSVAMVIALTLYDASRKAFAKGENATEQQESVRIAFDELTSDLRMLGHDVNPDGNPGRPDEQLEGALPHAIILRSNLDANDPAESATPETTLAGGAFPTVSTGNDEVVAYVLSRPDGSGPDSITFFADVAGTARDGLVEAVLIPNVVLNPTTPPYTLYRITLNNNPATYGTPAFIVRTPLAENVRDLSFVYHDVAGTFQDGSSSIPETAAARERRSGLMRVGVSIVGMTRQQDLAYRDTADPIAPTYRKFELVGDVTPRNMRLKGMPDLNADMTPPSKPARPTLVPGHCGGLLVQWTLNPLTDGVAEYRINWAGDVSGSRNVPGPPYFLDGLTTTPPSNYVVTIEARDATGNYSPRSDPGTATTSNLNTPSAPTAFVTSTDQPYRVMVSWGPVTTNLTRDPTADPIAPTARDLAGYRLYSNGNVVVSENVLSSGFAPPFYLTPVVACRNNSYTMTAVDTCGRESALTPATDGMGANTGVAPKTPTNVQAQFITSSTARIRWDAVREDVADQSIMIDRYNIYRSAPIDGASPPSDADWGLSPIVTAVASPYFDYGVPALPAGYVVYYRLAVSDDCGNVSANSQEARLDCTFAGDVAIDQPLYDGRVSGLVTTRVSVTGGGGESYTVRITYVHETEGLQRTYAASAPGPPWTDSGWNAVPTGRYTITATVTNAGGCRQTAVTQVTARQGVGGRP